MAPIAEKERQLACLSFLYEAINETCRAGADVAHSSDVAGQEENLSPTEILLCKLAHICDSRKGGDTITALVCLRGHEGPEYIICSNNRCDSELNECRNFLWSLLSFVIINPDRVAPKPLVKQVLWKVLEFNINRVGQYLKALSEKLAFCIEDCERHENGRPSPDLQHLLSIDERCRFPIDMQSTENSRALFLSNCSDLINIIQDTKAKGLAQTLNQRARMPNHEAWVQLRHLLGRLHSYRLAADTIVAASMRRPELFFNIRVDYVSSALPERSLVPRNLHLSQILALAFPDGNTASVANDLADLERCGLNQVIETLQHRHRNKTMVHCEAQMHGFLSEQGRSSPAQFVDGACFIATSKPPCKLCHVYFQALYGSFRVRAPHLNIYCKWRLPGIDDDAAREEILQDMVEQMQDDTVSLLREKRAQWRRNDSRTDSYAGFQSVMGESSVDSSNGGGARLASSLGASTRSQTVAEMGLPETRSLSPLSSKASSAGSWVSLAQQSR